MKNKGNTQAPQRVIAYVDGFNLYHGIKQANWKRYLWLDVHTLANSMMLRNQTLVKTRYFTARISRPRDSVLRQSTYIDALTAMGIEVVEGRFQMKDHKCPVCNHIHKVPE